MIRKAVVLTSMVLGLLFFATPAHAQYQPGQSCLLIVTPSTATVGTTVTAQGFGFPRASAVEVAVNGTVVATATASTDGQGSFTTTFKAPTTIGTATVTATCGAVKGTAAVNVIAATTTNTTGTLPVTGSDSSVPMVRVGLALVAAGGLLLLAVRRRRIA